MPGKPDLSDRPLGSIFAPELHGRLAWFSRLRWLAVCGLCLGSLLGRSIGLDRAWPSLLVIGLFVAGYNIVFWLAERRPVEHELGYSDLRTYAISQMVLDLTALLMTVHFTGGLQSPVLPFVVFHMTIGTIMIATGIMYVLATGVCLGVIGLYALERSGAFHAGQPAAGGVGSELNVLAVAALVYGSVYLTDSVTSRFKRRSIERHAAIVALRERTQQLQRSLAEREELERQKSHYLRISAHQLRSPLGTVKTSLKVLIGGYLDPGSEAGRHLLAGVSDRVDDLLAIVNDLLELAKMRDGQEQAPWARKLFINQILADIFDALEPLAQEHGISLVADIEGIAEINWGVPPDLVYAFENLIQNAIKYSHEGGEVTVSLRVDDGTATVVVEDRGIGIPEELQGEIFLEFVRAPSAKHHAAEGTGLGLTIVREAVKLHGGTVAVESEEGVGTRFVVTLPLDRVPPEVAQRESDSLE